MKERIEKAVEVLLQNAGDDWFMIIEEPAQEKFVQFAYDEESGLFFDLPFQALTQEELARARKVMAELSIAAAANATFDEPGGREIGVQESFNHHVDRDVKLAVDIAYRVFREVYGYGDSTRLDITIMR